MKKQIVEAVKKMRAMIEPKGYATAQIEWIAQRIETLERSEVGEPAFNVAVSEIDRMLTGMGSFTDVPDSEKEQIELGLMVWDLVHEYKTKYSTSVETIKNGKTR